MVDGLKMGIEWIIIIALGSGGLGAGVTAFFMRDEDPVAIVDNEAATIDAEVALELSNLDLIEPLCTTEFIEARGDGLCRELFCWMETNSVTGEASAISCDAISNINNTLTILETCSQVEGEEPQKACYTLFRERK